MPPKRPSRTPSRTPARKPQGTGAASSSTVLAFLIGAAVAGGAGYLYLHSRPAAHVPGPAASTAPPAVLPAPRAKPPQPSAPIPRTPPFGTSEDVFEAGAHLYTARCASCHGTPAQNAVANPSAPQLWRDARHQSASAAPGDLYNQIALGNPAKGMPAYAKTLTTTQIWQLSLLLNSANQDLPDPVLAILKTPPHRP